MANSSTPAETLKVPSGIVGVAACLPRALVGRNTLGMTLEMERIATGVQHLQSSGWLVHDVYDEIADAELMRDDIVEAAKRVQRKKKKGLFDCERKQSIPRASQSPCILPARTRTGAG